MIMTSSINRKEQVSGALKSFLQHLRTMLAKAGGHDASATDWDALLGDVLPDAGERRTSMARIMRSADFGAKVSTADWLMLENNHKGAIALYDQIAIDHPQEAAICLRCVGAAHYFLGNFETAIEFYQKALAAGEDAEIIAADIDEARDAIMMRDQPRQAA
jgi:tetratricopeptide (TPR) repeat protein